MSTTNSSVLNRHFKSQKPTKAHLAYLDKILANIDKNHMERVMEIRDSIELLLLDNPESENKVVSYLSGVNDKLNLINRKRGKLVKEQINTVCK